MYIAATTNPVAAIRAEARRAAGRASLPIRLCRLAARAWACRLERRIERAAARLEHPDVLKEMLAARRRG